MITTLSCYNKRRWRKDLVDRVSIVYDVYSDNTVGMYCFANNDQHSKRFKSLPFVTLSIDDRLASRLIDYFDGFININASQINLLCIGIFSLRQLQISRQSLSQMSYKLPGANNVVEHPINKQKYYLRSAIMSLNDEYKWTRERIADWLEALDMDLRFTLTDDSE